MIKINILNDEKFISSIEIIGHANYDVKGKDIVCSSVSSIAITTINGILSINNSYLKYISKDDLLKIEVLVKDEIVNKLMLNMINLLKELEQDYPKNIKIKEGENT
ncbi:MAG: ribosomal-processing cysteine protease Prp [Bacilli bacterium]